MTFLDLFAGIGGFRRGLELAGHQCVGFCEWDKYAAASYTAMHLLTDEQREKLAVLPLKQRQKEILKEEYRNGEWYASDICGVRAEAMPKADCWTFGAPCQDFSVAGTRSGMAGERSSLVREVFRLLRETEEGDRPEWLIYENVKGILSSRAGLDYLSILLEMEELGYDVQWQIFNSKDWGVPQNRERVYTVGHLREKGGSQIFPFPGADGTDQPEAKPILMNERPEPLPGGCKVPPIQKRVYDAGGISCTVTASPRFQPTYAVPCFIDKRADTIHERQVANAITATEDRGLSQRSQVGTAILLPVGCIDPQGRKDRAVTLCDTVPTLRAQSHGNEPEIVMPVLNPEKKESRQNGRRLKDCGNPAFTLTAQDHHGVAIGILNPDAADESHPGIFVQLSEDLVVYAIWYEKYRCYIVIRKLTPRECFRLQGWEDEYFDRAALVNTDSQLYKQAGNGVTVPVVYAIGCAIRDIMNHDAPGVGKENKCPTM
ncbi:MAG: DNA (cytosine-5-)-methyltransferase [Oscillospiraceae bacterium]|nr:DNA (cytosine-5-)-methyltransferase [Oscillospiraceae bacterium]